MKQLKVYGGVRQQSDGKQHRIVIAIESRVELAQLLRVGLYYVDHWWAETGNQREIGEAMKAPKTFTDMGII